MPISIKWFPPSWIQINARNTLLFIDPAYLKTYFKDYPKRIEFSSWPDPIDGLPEELEQADLILVTHHHKDHCKRVTVNRLRRPDTLVIAPKRCAKELGEDIQTIKPGERLSRANVVIEAVHAYNTEQGRSTRKQHHKGEGVGYLIMIEGRTIYHAGDTDFIPEMRAFGQVDVALLPIGGKFTMDISEAAEAAIAIDPKVVIPMHRFEADPRRLADEIETRSDIKLIPLDIGETYCLKDVTV
ncbi:MAG: MBL fold metallo-hydrolase [Desulfobacterales bacterium]|nr:MAG: MBL fold metallo-hydrolase [Desulfobacterales bacterium]